MIEKVVFILEELSMKRMLENLLPRMNLRFEIELFACNGKVNFKERMHIILEKYYDQNAFFIIMRDKDNDNCIELKNKLRDKIKDIGRPFRVRIVCRELESWYLAQPDAIKKAFTDADLKPSKTNKGKVFKEPEKYGAKEFMDYINQKQITKVKWAEQMGTKLEPDSSQSHSFHVFIQTLRDLSEGKILS